MTPATVAGSLDWVPAYEAWLDELPTRRLMFGADAAFKAGWKAARNLKIVEMKDGE